MNDCILRTEHVVKRFGGLIAVDDVSINCKYGEILGIIGANGAGKTTLFNMIAGEYPVSSGHIYFKDKRVGRIKAHQACAMGIGRTYQVVRSFGKMTVRENVMVGAFMHTNSVTEAAKKADEVIERVGLGPRREVFGDDLNLPERKRMELARALATEPTLLLLDEVMAGLNSTQVEDVIQLVREIREGGTTIILIEHIMKAVMNLSDRLYVLNQGRLISEGTPSFVANDPEVIKSYLGERK